MNDSPDDSQMIPHVFSGVEKIFKNFLRQILSSSTRFEQKEKFKLSNLNLDLIRLRPRSAMED